MAVLGLRFCARASSSCGKRGPLLIAVRGPLTLAASLVAEHRLQTRRLSNYGSWAQPLRGMWDPPRPGHEPVSPALAGRFSTTAPPGKPKITIFKCQHFLDAWEARYYAVAFVGGCCAGWVLQWAFILSWDKGLNLPKGHLRHWMLEYLKQVWRNRSKCTLVSGSHIGPSSRAIREKWSVGGSLYRGTGSRLCE